MKRSYVIFLLFVIILAGCGGKDGVDESAPAAPEETGALPTDPTTDANTRVATNTPPTPTEVRIKTVSLSKCFVGEMCTRKIEADGASAYKWEIGLPDGFVLGQPTDGHKITFKGTPSEAGTLKIGVKVLDRTDETKRAQKELKLVVSKTSQRELGLEDDVPQECFYGEDCKGALTATGGSKKYTWLKTGQLPDGLSWGLTNDGKVVEIKGQPTKLGAFQIGVKLTDQEDEGATIERDIELTVRDRVEIKFYSIGTDGKWNRKEPTDEIKISSGGELKIEVTGHAPRYAATLMDGNHRIAWDCNTCETKFNGLTLYRYPDSRHAFLGEGIIDIFVNDAFAAIDKKVTTPYNSTTAQTLPSAQQPNLLRSIVWPIRQRYSPNGKTFYLTADESSLDRKFERVRIDVEDEYGNRGSKEIGKIIFEAPVVAPPPPLTVKPSGSFTKKIGDPSDMDSAVSCNEDPNKPSVVTKIYAGYDYGLDYIRFGCKELNKLSDTDAEVTLAKEGWGDRTRGTTKGFDAPEGFALVGWRTTARYPGHISSLTPYAKKVDEFGVHDEIVWRGPKIYYYGEEDEKRRGGGYEIGDNICPDGEVLIGVMGGGTDRVRFLTGICGRVDDTVQRPTIKDVRLERPQEMKLEPPIGKSDASPCRQTCWDETRQNGVVVGVGIHDYNGLPSSFGEKLLCADVSATDGSLVYKNAGTAHIVEATAVEPACGEWFDYSNSYRHLNLGYVATGFYGQSILSARDFEIGLLSAPFDVFDFQGSYEISNGWPVYETMYPQRDTIFGIPGKPDEDRTQCPAGSILTGITFTYNSRVSGITSFECARVNIVKE